MNKINKRSFITFVLVLPILYIIIVFRYTIYKWLFLIPFNFLKETWKEDVLDSEDD